MSEPKFFCPRRGEAPVMRGYRPEGEWRTDADGVRRCSWCGYPGDFYVLPFFMRRVSS